MTTDTTIEKMESTPFSRNPEALIVLSYNGAPTSKPHIFACYNNEVSSSLYLHNKLIVLDPSSNYYGGNIAANDEMKKMLDKMLNDVNTKFGDYLLKSAFYDFTKNLNIATQYFRYIKDIDLLFTDKPMATAKGFVMFSTGDVSGGGSQGGSGGSGTMFHQLLEQRDVADQHPIAAITGLDNILNSKISTTDPRLSDSRKASDVYAWAKAAVKPIYGISEITGLPAFINTFNNIFDTSISNRLKIKLPTHVNGVISTDQSVVMFGTGDGSTPTPSVSTLATLLDVSLATINDKDLLSFDAATQKWKNISASLIEGTKDHRLLTNRDVADQHPTAAITGLDNILNSKVSTTDPRLSDSRKASDVYAWAKAAVKPTYTAAEVGALKIIKSNLVNGDNIDWNSVNFDMNAITISQIAVTNYNGQSNYPFSEYGQLLTFGSNDSLFSSQLAISNSAILSFRATYNSSVFNTQWNTVWHNNNFNPATKVDTNGGTATYATELRCPGNWQGNLIIGTSRGLLTGFPNDSSPTIKTSFSSLYFDVGGQYVGGIGKTNTVGQLAIFDSYNKGIKLNHNNGTPATVYCGTILSSSSVVMYSTI